MKNNEITFDYPQIEKLKIKTRDYIFKAQYKKAEQYLLRQRKKYPNHLFIQSTLAAIKYEVAFYKDDKIMQKEFAKAAKRLKNLLKSNSNIREEDGYRNLNEYYWFSQQYKKQYLLGVSKIKLKSKRGYYSQGVGATHYAAQLKSEGKDRDSYLWAKRAEKAWLHYFKHITKTYYDPWAWYALSLGLQGKAAAMEKAIQKSAQLSLRSVKHPFFKKVRRLAQVD